MANAETFGARLKRIRKIKGLSQKELAKNSGVSQQMICQYEKGLRTPGAYPLLRISIILVVSMEYLLTGRERNG